jgi:dTDP-4-dehydrorhamnose reductase
MKIVLLGKNGQLGWELQRALSPLGELIALGRNDASFCGDLTKPEALLHSIQDIKPDVLVNAAAYTAVDLAETQSDLAFEINAKTVALLAESMAALDGLFVHYSTDYVFNGKGNTPWQETDNLDPLSVYGKSKLAGEEAIQAQAGKHLIFRTSWVYGAHGYNFIKTILKLAKEKESLSIVADQIGAPTGAELLADVTAHAIRACQKKPELAGLYHLTALGETSWYDYTHFILNEARQLGSQFSQFKVSSIVPISTQEFPRPAPRPLNSRLNTKKISQAFSLQLPNWQPGVKRALIEILEPQV